MGQEISHSQFNAEDFAEFHRRLVEETALLRQWIEDGALEVDTPMGGCELEAWLVDRNGLPASSNDLVLEELKHPLVVPELSTFNVELNTPPADLGPGFFDTMYRDLSGLWEACEVAARRYDAHMMMIGILPTVRQRDLTLDNMSSMERYRALNEQVLSLRGGKPIELDINGLEQLQRNHDDVMLEAATTSFQIHLKVDAKDAVRAFNVSKILSAPMVGVSANSPYLFERDLWDETRIPLFEQAVSVGGSDYSKRVTFGIRYAQDSIVECFEANRDRYPVLIPQVMDEPVESLAHLRLHNGTIWRWNRPLVGFCEDGSPHIRIEHRVVPSGPSVMDVVANAAFYFGMATALIGEAEAPEGHLPYEHAMGNFYSAAKHGLNARVTWLDGKEGSLKDLCLEQLIPLARSGLTRLGMSSQEVSPWLDVIRNRVLSGMTGTRWQRAWVAAHGRDFPALVQAYRRCQMSGKPVHEWQV